MKKITALFLAILTLMTLVSCNKAEPVEKNTESQTTSPTSTTPNTTLNDETTVPETSEPEDKDWNDDGALKILCIGNSFSYDTMYYLYDILKDMGIAKIKLGNLVIGGCSLFNHYANAKSENKAYEYYQNVSGAWTSSKGHSLNDVVKSENWDFISLQQASHDSGVENTYGQLPKLIEIVEELCPRASLVWNMTWAYQQDSTHASFPVYNKDQMTMYNKIVSTVHAKVLTEPSIVKVSPAATAIQNVRAGWIGDTVTIDGFHLDDVGRYVAALTFAQTLTGKSIENVTYVPTGFSAAKWKLAKEAATLAVEKPYEVSIPTTEAPKTPSIDDLYELKVDFERGYYYACQEGGSHFNRYQGSDFDNKFYSTQIFTKETLPEGSVIIIADGWQYRPESWLGDYGLPSHLRPNSRTDTMIVVDDLWWGKFTYRAFNISKPSQVSLLDLSPEDMSKIFKVYVPYDPAAENNG